MLFEFHRQQNAKKPGSIHATYLLYGTRRRQDTTTTLGRNEDGDNLHMQSSPIMSSYAPQPEENQEVTAVQTIILVREEDLSKLTSSFERLSSIHVYSLESGPLHGLQTLSDATREILSAYGQEDPMEYGPIYGTIHNSGVRRRKGGRPQPQAIVPAVQKTKASPAPEKPRTSTDESKPATQPSTSYKASQTSTAKDFFSKAQNDKIPTPSASQKSVGSAPTLKRDSSSIFKAFAKAKPKLMAEASDTSAASSTQASAAEDSPMKDVSDEEEDYVPPLQASNSKENANRDRQAKMETEAALRKMMEDDDEQEITPITPREEAEEVDEPEITIDKPAEPEPEPVTEVRDGRRRGKRRVMKKRTLKDEEGYLGMLKSPSILKYGNHLTILLVTREEAVWESFSEDEPVARKAKIQSTTSSTAATRKPAPKTGQGSIMSFFGKK